jgi:dipeptidyl-peptidase-4
MRTRCNPLPAVLLALLLNLPLAAQSPTAAAKKPLTLEAIFSASGLTGRRPQQLRWSPDGQGLSYILQADEGERRDLWVVEGASGEKRVLVSYEELAQLAPTVEQATADERERERRLRYSVASYRWSPDAKSILFTSAGQLYLYDLAASKAQLLAPDKRAVGDAKFSPDGQWISFLFQHDLWLVPVSGGAEKQLTFGGNENVLHGELDWVYPEEFEVRTGYHWAPDSRRIAFLEIDQHPVPFYPISDLVRVVASVDLQRYPKAGDPNPKVRVGIVDIESALARSSAASPAETLWLNRTAEYIPRIGWVDADRVAVQLLDRSQQTLELVLAEASSGRSRVVLTERDPYWINLSNDLTFLANGKELLWTSERTGFRHIYLYDLSGESIRQLTGTEERDCSLEGVPKEESWVCSGWDEWEVNAIEAVDEENGWVYYTSNEANSLGRDLFRVKLDASSRQRLTTRRGTHAVLMNPTATAYADAFSALTAVPELSVRRLPSDRSTRVHSSRSLDDYAWVQPELVEIRAPNAALVRGMMLKPSPLQPGKRYPVVLYVYGGPRAPTIRDAWLGARFLFHQYLAQQGLVVFYVDDTTSALLGHRHEAALSRFYGPRALRDYRLAVKHLAKLPFVNTEEMALWGWSGGGFSTSFALTHSDLFKVGVAVAPVTDWRLYDSIYSERYMGLPQEETEAYRETSVVEAAANLSGRLLLVHGDTDDNVHLQHTTQLINALVKAGRPYDLLLYPGKTHSLRGSGTQLHLFRAITAYLQRHLTPAADRPSE